MAWFYRFKYSTLTQQWFFATVLATLPLLLAVAYAAWSLATETQQYRRLLLSVTALKDLDAAVGRQVAGLERTSLQYVLIRDERFRDLYEERINTLQKLQRQWLAINAEQEQLSTIHQMVERIIAFHDYLAVNPELLSVEVVRRDWQEINRLAAALSAQVDGFTGDAVRDNKQRIETVIQRLIIIGAFTLPATALLLMLSTRTVARPVRSLTDAIQQLGQQRWEKAVVVKGPEDLVKLGKHLERMREQLQASDRQKQAFLRHITHELKSPLAAIVEAESLLRDEVPGSINDDQKQVLQILHRNANNLIELIQQLLNYNAIKHSVRPELKLTDIDDICAAQWRRLSEDGKPAVNCHWAGTVKQVRTDSLCLEMILSNLLSNAKSLVPADGNIRISWGEDGPNWWLSVEDNGPGVHPDEVEAIFKPFYQGSVRRTGALKGSGIGLSIVRECVERLGGTISVSTSSLGGANFTLFFPGSEERGHPIANEETATVGAEDVDSNMPWPVVDSGGAPCQRQIE